MSEKKIIIPPRLTSVTNVFNMGIQRINLSKFDKCTFSFEGTTFGEPLPMIVLAKEIQGLMRRYPNLSFFCQTRSCDFRGYADHIGYFRLLGFDRGNKLGVADGSANYVPIQVFDLERLREVSGDRPYAEIVEEKASELAHVLTQKRSGGVFVALQYLLREVMRNAIEHSFGTKLSFFAQNWSRKNQSEIVICDNGVGIREGLKGANRVSSDTEALRLALKPGVSGVTEREKSYQNEHYRNSGFGLYASSRFCSERGVFRLLSSGAGLTANRTSLTDHDWRFSGTCVQMKIDTTDLENAERRILEIIEDGNNALAACGSDHRASTASKQVSGWIKSIDK